LRILGFNATKEKLEIVIGAAPPPFRIFAGGLPRPDLASGRNAPCPVVSFALLLGFGLIQEYCTFRKLCYNRHEPHRSKPPKNPKKTLASLKLWRSGSARLPVR